MIQANIIQKNKKNEPYLKTVRLLWKSEGFAGFYKGLAITYVKIIPMLGLAFMVNEIMKEMLEIK